MKRYIQFALFSFSIFFILVDNLSAQNNSTSLEAEIPLKNGSFEDKPSPGARYGHAPNGWYDCGKEGETAPDIHPAVWPDTAYFGVTMQPSEGKTYLGMVVRDNVTWEAVAQRLRSPMKGGQCYNFSIDLARSKTYLSSTKYSPRLVNYAKPTVLRVWGGNGSCMKLELLDESDPVKNHDWRTYNFRLEPARNYAFIILEVFYKTPVLKEYNGNMLLDNASSLTPVPCSEAPKPSVEAPKDEDLLASTNPVNTVPAKPKKNAKKEQPKPQIDKTSPEEKPKATGKPAKKPKEFVKELDNDLVVGQEITLNKLFFDADSSILSERYYPIVDDVYSFLLENENVTIEVGGHTNNRCEEVFCNSLSEDRAKSVANYLIQKGIPARRVAYKGYGKNNPKYPNSTPTNRRRNQRVEIKILSKN